MGRVKRKSQKNYPEPLSGPHGQVFLAQHHSTQYETTDAANPSMSRLSRNDSFSDLQLEPHRARIIRHDTCDLHSNEACTSDLKEIIRQQSGSSDSRASASATKCPSRYWEKLQPRYARSQQSFNIRGLITLCIYFLIVLGALWHLVDYLLIFSRASAACTAATVYVPVTQTIYATVTVTPTPSLAALADSSDPITSFTTVTVLHTSTVTLLPVPVTSAGQASSASPYYFVVESGTTSWLNGNAPPTGASLALATTSMTVMPLPDTTRTTTTTTTGTTTITIDVTANAVDSPTYIHTTRTSTLYSTTTIFLPAVTSSVFSVINDPSNSISTSTHYLTSYVSFAPSSFAAGASQVLTTFTQLSAADKASTLTSIQLFTSTFGAAISSPATQAPAVSMTSDFVPDNKSSSPLPTAVGSEASQAKLSSSRLSPIADATQGSAAASQAAVTPFVNATLSSPSQSGMRASLTPAGQTMVGSANATFTVASNATAGPLETSPVPAAATTSTCTESLSSGGLASNVTAPVGQGPNTTGSQSSASPSVLAPTSASLADPAANSPNASQPTPSAFASSKLTSSNTMIASTSLESAAAAASTLISKTASETLMNSPVPTYGVTAPSSFGAPVVSLTSDPIPSDLLSSTLVSSLASLASSLTAAPVPTSLAGSAGLPTPDGYSQGEVNSREAESDSAPIPYTATTSAMAASTEACGEVGSFVLSFDDLPSFNPQNQTDITQQPPVFSPYHHLSFSEGYVYAPKPTEPFSPVSSPNVAVFLASGSGMRASGALHQGEIGDGPRSSLPAYWFDAFSVYIGCDNAGPSNCTVSLTGYTWSPSANDEVQSVQQNTTISPCPGFKDCQLEKVDFPSSFRGLSGLQIQASVEGESQMFFVDNLVLGWTNNTCAAGQQRSSSH